MSIRGECLGRVRSLGTESNTYTQGVTETGPLEPLASPGGDTLVEERTSSVDDGDHERFAHYVEKDKIVESAVTGKPVTALCGKKWTPGRDPSKFPICPECQEIHASLPRGGD